MLCRLTNKGRILSITAIGLLLAGAATVSGCVHSSNGTLWLREAPLAEGWPQLTPVGEVEVKDYPQVRVAVVRDDKQDTPDEDMNSMFGKLFNHIKSNDIAMTTPVEMGYEGRDDTGMTSMAFLYRQPDQGTTGDDGPVSVEDVPGRTFASVGVRGSYTPNRFADALAALDAWLQDHADQWQADGPPRYLGYNSPFVPGFMRYGEVQRPVRPVQE